MYNERQKVWQRENRALLVQCHLCRQCGAQDARTLNGYSYCYECGEKRKGYYRNWRKKHAEEANVKRRERYAELKEQGKCPVCGRDLVFTNNVVCACCAARQNNHRKERYEHKRVGGKCFQCCQAEPLPGKKLCRECYDKNMVKLQMMWRKRGIIC